MKYLKLPFRCRRSCELHSAGLKAAVLTLFFASASAFAIAPPALTSIGNTASASFTDSSGNSSLVTSNPVVTIVLPVGGLTLDGVAGSTTPTVNTKTTTAGTIVYAPHILTNTGNGSDGFNISVTAPTMRLSKIEVFLDDGSGNPLGTALCSATLPNPCAIAAPVTVAGSNGTYKFVVAYTVPPTAFGSNPYETATVTASPITASQGIYTAPFSIAVKDEINLTTGAAFTLNKSISVPKVSAPGGGAWPTAISNGPKSSSLNCPTQWTNTLATAPQAGCQYTVYTLTFSNSGLTPGQLVFTDSLPTGLTYVANSAIWSNSSTVLHDDGSTGGPLGISYKATGTGFTAIVAQLGAGATQTLSFVVLVNPQSVKGSGSTSNVVSYNSVDAPAATIAFPGPLPSRSATAPYVVAGTYGVTVGAVNSSGINAHDATAGIPDPTNIYDNTLVTSAAPGSIVKFSQKIFNIGDSVDTFNLKITSSAFPPGTNFLLLAADGSTLLNDTGALDGIVDTGPILPGASATVTVAALLPSNLNQVGQVNYAAILTGTSLNDPTKIDATRDLVANISLGLVDLTNTASGNGIAGTTSSGDVGAGPSPNPTTINSTTPGTPVGFNLFITNYDTSSQTYQLSASSSSDGQSSLPPGWSVRYIQGAGQSCTAGVAVSNTGPVGTQQQVAITACVTPGLQQLPVIAAKVYFKVTATSPNAANVIATDIKTDAVTVTASASANYSATLVGNNSGQVLSGGTVVYPHVLTNIGAQSCGSYTLHATFQQADIDAGWTAVVYLDVNGDGRLDAGDSIVTGPIAAGLQPGAGNAKKYLVRVAAPNTQSTGAVATATVVAAFDPGASSCGSPTVFDRTTVISGLIRVVKLQAPDINCHGSPDVPPSANNLSVRPGNCIFYSVTALNQGVAAVSNLTIADKVPAYTTVNMLPTQMQCTASTGAVGTFAFAATPTQVSCGGQNVVNPGNSVTLQYSIVIDH